MTDIIQLAKQAGGTAYTNRHYPGETAMAFGPDALERFEELIRADEREQIAILCETQVEEIGTFGRRLGPFDKECEGLHAGMTYAKAIRARTTP